LESELTNLCGTRSPRQVLGVEIKNSSERSRTISVFSAVDLVLGDSGPSKPCTLITELEPLTGRILARNRYNGDFADPFAFFDCSETIAWRQGDRAEFLGPQWRSFQPCRAALRDSADDLDRAWTLRRDGMSG